MLSPFDQPIPGQSLTTEPKNNPWEQPPQMSDIEEVTKYYIMRLANQDVIDDFAAMIDAGLPLAPLVKTIVNGGTLRGLHTVDAGMLVTPVIHTFLKQALQSMGMSVKDSSIDPQKQAEKAELERFRLIATKYLMQDDDPSDPGKAMISELVEAAETGNTVTEEAEEPQEEQPTGLMSKG